MVKNNVEKRIEIVTEKGQSYGQFRIMSKYLYRQINDNYYWALNEMKYYLQRYSTLCETEQRMIEMLGMDECQVGRLHIAARTVLQWKFCTDWERSLQVPILDKLEKFIFGDRVPTFDT